MAQMVDNVAKTDTPDKESKRHPAEDGGKVQAETPLRD
jgi:hypothetical protein